MNYPISIFILDVSNSSSADMGEKLTNYLDELVNWINVWTKEIGHCKVKHRAGDEIIFVGNGYSTAYILAFFISRIWRFKDHTPYFGLSFGDIATELQEVDIEKWIHPLIKQARYANDLLKQEQVRTPFKFELDQFYENHTFPYNQFRSEFEVLFNSLLRLQMTMISEQTPIQEKVCTYYLILQQQKAIGKLLGKTAPTISSHYKKGKAEEILTVFGQIITILNSFQEKSYLNNQGKTASESLMDSIRKQLKENIDIVITK
ncbi:hypothetical protein J2Y03_003300 [Neobacillus niacini]|uniref:hypothetical protein n=1 Tax=Neobacillus niacini TaxID=86668 RepID=UPI00285C71D0|nr:hypothetical protein [Neobacillus niacini]MDR7078250.1 hypothetical protein [Neobacillus niacini]